MGGEKIPINVHCAIQVHFIWEKIIACILTCCVDMRACVRACVQVCVHLRAEIDCMYSAVCTEQQIFVLEEEQDSVELSKHSQNSLGNTVSSRTCLKYHAIYSSHS